MAFSYLMACNNKSEPLFAIIFGYIWFVLITHKRIEAILFGRCWVTQCFLLIVHNFTGRMGMFVCACLYVNVKLTIDWCGNVFSIFIYFYCCTFPAQDIAWNEVCYRVYNNNNNEEINKNKHTRTHKPTTWKYAFTIVRYDRIKPTNGLSIIVIVSSQK